MFCVVNSTLYSALLGQTHKFTELSAKVCQKSAKFAVWRLIVSGAASYGNRVPPKGSTRFP